MNAAETLRVERSADLVRLVIDRPPANALDTALASRIAEVLDMLAGEGAPPVVLTAAGERFFCPGGDIREFETIGREGTVSRMHGFHHLLNRIEQYPGPLVCAAKGYAVGGGFELTLFADAVVAGPGAQFGFPEINHGLVPAARGMRQAARLFGLKTAKAMLFSGKFLTAAQALEAGFLTAVVPNEEVVQRAEDLAREWGAKDREILATMKRLLASGEDMTADELDAATLSIVRETLSRQEAAEARQRFLVRDKA